ncbi:MAG TPA: glycosyltransferase, partial [Chloroflexia bacterium]|nr:glycosyltransferase [Chloroflexia bacterium]
LVGSTHPCHNPRLIREADTLAAMGHDVRVVAPSFMSELHEKDRRLIATREWQLLSATFRPTKWRGKYRSLLVRGRKWFARELFGRLKWAGAVEYAFTAALPELKRLALREQADWYVAHAHPALPVAAAAAKHWQARLGFDCEDLLAELGADPPDIVRHIERKYLPACDYVSVPSQAIAKRLQGTNAIQAPIVLYNVFPLALADGLPGPAERTTKGTLRLHWFGQTIGPGRGLEEAIEAMKMLGPGVELHIRGLISGEYRATLADLVREPGTPPNIFFYPQIDHDDLIRSLGEFDVGLALERPENGNYSRTVSNKIFSYLLAGLAVAATDTPGQREVMGQVPSAGFLYPAGEPGALAAGLRRWKGDTQGLGVAQQAAWDAARQRFCWDIEQRAFLHVLGVGVPEGVKGDICVATA